MKNFRKGTILTLWCVTALLVTGCFWQSSQNPPKKLPPLRKIAVLPMDRASTKPASERPTCNIGGQADYSSAYVTPEAAQKVTQILYSLILKDKRFKPVTQGQCMGLLNDILQRKVNPSELKILRAFGRDLDADAILYGKLYRFRERVGSEYAVKTPASVAFSLILVRVSDGRVLWRYSFDETQQALTENLFNWKFYKSEGMRWVTAEELAAYGLKKAVEELEKALS
ncbi:MAG: hypothetical protein GXO58_09425 [Thermodesulfobacteria bacterium]|nr:hypothetical protein [Thermodesulfobacteriota bacterium]